MKVINRQTFSIAKHLESGREAAAQTDRSDRSCRVHVCVPLSKKKKKREVQTEQKGTEDNANAATDFKKLQEPQKSSQEFIGTDEIFRASLGCSREGFIFPFPTLKTPRLSPLFLPLVCSLHLNEASRFLL